MSNKTSSCGSPGEWGINANQVNPSGILRMEIGGSLPIEGSQWVPKKVSGQFRVNFRPVSDQFEISFGHFRISFRAVLD